MARHGMTGRNELGGIQSRPQEDLGLCLPTLSAPNLFPPTYGNGPYGITVVGCVFRWN